VQGAFKHRRSLLSNTGSSSSHRPHLTSADRHSRRAQDSPHVSHDSMSAARALLAQDTGSDEAYFERMMDQLEGSSEQSWKGLEGRGRRRLQGCRESRVVYRFMVGGCTEDPCWQHDVAQSSALHLCRHSLVVSYGVCDSEPCATVVESMQSVLILLSALCRCLTCLTFPSRAT
jgi:hypothetical protein